MTPAQKKRDREAVRAWNIRETMFSNLVELSRIARRLQDFRSEIAYNIALNAIQHVGTITDCVVPPKRRKK